MRTRFILLGSGAVRNNPRRAGPSQVLSIGEMHLMFDCGRAATWRLGQEGLEAEQINRLFLTHLHFDHTCDLPYFILLGWNNGRRQTLRLFGPEGTRQFAGRLIRPPFEQDINSRLGHGKDPFGLDPDVQEIAASDPVEETDAYRVAAVPVEHAGMPSLAYRVDTGERRIVITGDGRPGAGFVSFCRNADLLVTECSGTADFLARYPWGAWHSTPPDIARLAREAEVGQVMIKHLVIEDIMGDRDVAQRMADEIARDFAGEITVGTDGMSVEWP